ncbi:MAG: CDP-alcohol phosphatidyltransferase family protein [Thermoplasmatales archaeon]|nr:CDP-alcohol phosphatidyltransferase family protein [Candidatus Thermoplasmatota archaeon]MCL6002849.1 CDP-alcohol phosphatidyltransferase family protein [Candidatus Thermoplasmatota archaeon]MDA8054289.1 CDP-alcohol phosphatidyltransferase family protein [Thermoplasmatales archaeon]
MVLDKARSRSAFLLEGTASRLKNVNPNSITMISFFLAILFAVSYYFGFRNLIWLIVAFFLLIGSSYLDALDGAVARKFQKESKKGDFLDHLLDRYSDFVILFGMTVSFFGNLYFGILAIAGTFMSSYVGTQSQAVGLNRLYSGFPGRADRLVIIMIVTIIQIFTFRITIFGFYITSWTLVFLGIAGFVNSVYRARLAYRSVS